MVILKYFKAIDQIFKIAIFRGTEYDKVIC